MSLTPDRRRQLAQHVTERQLLKQAEDAYLIGVVCRLVLWILAGGCLAYLVGGP